jgi:hypothetical protein
MKSRSFWRRFGVWTILAGLAIAVGSRFTQRRKETEVSAQILDRISSREHPTTEEAGAVGELFEASLNTRVEFLSSALSAAYVERVRMNEQGLSVALSRVKSADAGALIRRAILPALTISSDAKVLLEGDVFMRRWGISGVMSQGERDSLASKLVERIYEENERDLLNALSTVLSGIAEGVRPKTADALSRRLIQRIAHDHDARSREALVAGLIALAPSEEIVSRLIDMFLEEPDPYGLQILARDAREFEKKLGAAKAAEIAQKLTARLAGEPNSLSVQSLEGLLEPLQETIGPRETAEVASALVDRAKWEWSGTTVQALMSGLSVFGKKLDQATARELAQRLAARLDLEPSAETVAIFATGLGGMDRADDSTIEMAAAHVVARIAKEPDAANIESLAEALAALKERAGERNIGRAATTIVKRMIREPDLNAQVTLSSAVEKLDGEMPRDEAEALGTEIVARVVVEPDHSAILPLTMAIDALDESIDAPKAEELVSKLLVRMRVDHDPEVLRALAVGMRFLKDKASTDKFEEAASILVAAMKRAQSPEDLRTLAFGLHSFIAKAGAAPFEEAASQLIARMAAEPDPAVQQVLVEGLEAIQSRVRAEQVDQAASILVDRITEQTSAEKIDSLALDLEGIQDRVAPIARSRLASRLMARMAGERDPNLLRALGKALASLPVDSLTPAQIGQIGRVFRIANAPCDIALHVQIAERLGSIAIELLNPFCSESSWTNLAASLGEITRQPIVRGNRAQPTPDLDFDGMGALKDDDDEGTAKPGETDAVERISVDFNLLSRVLAGIRPKDAFWSWQIGIDLLSGFLVFLGLICLVLSCWPNLRRGQEAA